MCSLLPLCWWPFNWSQAKHKNKTNRKEWLHCIRLVHIINVWNNNGWMYYDLALWEKKALGKEVWMSVRKNRCRRWMNVMWINAPQRCGQPQQQQQQQHTGERDSSVVRAPDSWWKGRGFEPRLERWEKFLLQRQPSVLTLISVSVPPPCYRSST